MANTTPPYLAIAGIGIVAFGFFAYETVANVTSSSSGYVVTVHSADAHAVPAAPAPAGKTPETARAAQSRLTLAAMQSHPTLAAAKPHASLAPGVSSPAPAPTPSASVAPSPVAVASAAPALTPRERSAEAAKRPAARARVPLAATKPQTDAKPSRERTNDSPPVAGSYAVAAATAGPANAPAAGASAAAAAPTAAAVALAPAAAPDAPAYAPERVVTARVRSAVEPDMPDDPTLEGVHATSYVVVTIGPSGRVLKTAIEKSSGYAKLDVAAVRAATASTYEPPLIDGRPATESYRMVYDFK